MRCPKCHYIGFDRADRCRNCGYDFSLIPPATDEPDLLIRDPAAVDGPLSDFVLTDGLRTRRTPADPRPRPPFDPERLILSREPLSVSDRQSLPDFGSPPQPPAVAERVTGPDPLRDPERPTVHERPKVPSPIASRDLPLFQTAQAAADDAPLITPRAVPRPPLAVRRATPDPARLRDRQERHRPDEAPLELDSFESLDEQVSTSADTQPETSADVKVARRASPFARIGAGLVDATLILAIDSAVIHFTLQLSGLTMDEVSILPLAPLLGFFAILNGGYFFAFTAAGGQTIGKMMAGIRVVSREQDRVMLAQAAIRTAGYLLSALPAGAGFLAALFSADGLALHDRLAGTQVVPASYLGK